MLAKKAEELERIITVENLNAEATRAFIDNAFRDGAIPSAGTAITKVLPLISRFSKDNGHGLCVAPTLATRKISSIRPSSS